MFYNKLAIYMAQRGHEVHVVTSKPRVPMECKIDDKVFTHCVGFNMNIIGIRTILWRLWAPKAVKVLERIKPDIVHFTGWLLPYVKKQNRALCIYQPLGLEELVLPSWKKPFRRLFLCRSVREMLKRSELIFSLGEPNTWKILEIGGNEIKNKIRVLPAGVDVLEVQQAKPLQFPGDTENFLYVGRLVRSKGIYQLLEEISIFKKIFYKPFKLYVVGAGKEEKKIVKTVNRLGLSNIVVFLGRLPYEKLWGYMKTASLILIPTLYEGGCPNHVTLEAMAAGGLILANDIPQIKVAIKDGLNGFISSVTKRGEWARKMLYILKLPEYKKRAVRRQAEKDAWSFDWSYIVKQAEEYYRGVIGSF